MDQKYLYKPQTNSNANIRIHCNEKKNRNKNGKKSGGKINEMQVEK